MNKITLIKAEIQSVSPLYVSDGEDILIEEREKKAHIPATSIAGAFRAYLKSIGEDETSVFGSGAKKDSESIKSSVYISDSFSSLKGFERRDGVRIDRKTGANAKGAKIERLYLSKGLNFDLKIEILDDEDGEVKNNIYKCLNAVDRSAIRFGGHKSNGLGIFKIKRVYESDYNLKKKSDLKKYLKRDGSKTEDVTDAVLESGADEKFVSFAMDGEFTTPLLIGASESYNPDDSDYSSMKSGDDYIVPGSTLKGILRFRIESIAKMFGSKKYSEEIFGSAGKGENMLSRLWVNESVIDSSECSGNVYNQIKVDKFTGGVRDMGLMNATPTIGKTEFKLMYKKTGDKSKDDYALGLISLAMRDLGTENLPISGGGNKGRGRFKARSMRIVSGQETIDIDFENKTISNGELLESYIESARSFKAEGDKNE